MTSPAAQAAAHWWGQILRREFIVHDNGDDQQSMMLTTFQPRGAHDHDPAKVERFEDLLASEVDRQLERLPVWGFVFVGTDYHPDAILADAYEQAGLGTASMFTFPAKTRMRVTASEVTAAEGYGKEHKPVWTAEVTR